MIRVVLVDDSRIMQQTIEEKLSFYTEIELKFKAVNGEDLLDRLEKNPRTDLILMDIEMPKMNGIEATFQVKQRFPHIKIIMLTVFDNDENIFMAIKAGADGYLLKETNPEELYRAITETMNGGASMTPSIALKTLRMFREPVDFRKTAENDEIKLTTRETEVLEQLSTGLKYKQIATNLIISTGTVRKHIENIYAKLQVCNKLEAIRKAKDNNLI
jgi:DNA-binding NarL/FixJ family response regulator